MTGTGVRSRPEHRRARRPASRRGPRHRRRRAHAAPDGATVSGVLTVLCVAALLAAIALAL